MVNAKRPIIATFLELVVFVQTLILVVLVTHAEILSQPQDAPEAIVFVSKTAQQMLIARINLALQALAPASLYVKVMLNALTCKMHVLNLKAASSKGAFRIKTVGHKTATL